MKVFALYTAARAGLFLVCYAVIWLVAGRWMEWNSVNALLTALLGLLVSAIVALKLLASLRDRLAGEVAARADRAMAAFEARRSAEDVDDG